MSEMMAAESSQNAQVAQVAQSAQSAQSDRQPQPGFAPHPAPVNRLLTWRNGDDRIDYEATAGHLDVREDDGRPIASLFVVSYVATRVSEGNNGENGGDGAVAAGSADAGAEGGARVAPAGPERPVTFLFNGGPGSSSVWLNTGGFGPRKAPSTAPMPAGAAPYPIEDNPATLLRYSDLVFIDAPGTGWSVTAPGVPASRVWDMDGDADVFCRAVVDWIAANGRWNAPKYLFGESYATTRVAVMANMIQNRCIDLNGVIMLSNLLDWASEQPGADIGYINLIPSYAAAAAYHRALAAGADPTAANRAVDGDLLRRAEDFALGEYAAALIQGDRLGADRERKVAGRLGELVGVPADELIRRHLRLDMEDFRALLRRDEGLIVGRFDARYVASNDYVVGSGGADPATNDAATAGVNSAEVCAFRAAISEIGFTWNIPYLVLNNMQVEPNWGWSHQAPALDGPMMCPNTALDLSAAMRRNPLLKVAVMGGKYDLACPYLSVRNDIAHLFLAPRLRANLSFGLYATGHMAYVDAAALNAMDADLARFYRDGRF
ncbi:S10 family peptidase [Bifidobacterium vespertilionis]|uniref:Peptidase S10 n=1 Tax=Bifidobacterium vespertilionis TaxID=2562524 RepID=A0A5J5DVG5_9BIFI|nr:peptidase S10 [Bifidobacterium vespertilionis]KAA8820801.1 peptidase S10 [Bifidobacterium vespertilionis]KAA8822270.1 peptidase S10 [Bifidobacterium vespertilionis]